METFSIEHPISVDFRLRDPSGVTTVTAFFRSEDPLQEIILRGNGYHGTDVTVRLAPVENRNWHPAEFHCARLDAIDLHGNTKTYTEQDTPGLAEKRFRWEYPCGTDQEGPELIL
jgi:hypothetical protein